jgi:hypothetical protein
MRSKLPLMRPVADVAPEATPKARARERATVATVKPAKRSYRNLPAE